MLILKFHILIFHIHIYPSLLSCISGVLSPVLLGSICLPTCNSPGNHWYWISHPDNFHTYPGLLSCNSGVLGPVLLHLSRFPVHNGSHRSLYSHPISIFIQAYCYSISPALLLNSTRFPGVLYGSCRCIIEISHPHTSHTYPGLLSCNSGVLGPVLLSSIRLPTRNGPGCSLMVLAIAVLLEASHCLDALLIANRLFSYKQWHNYIYIYECFQSSSCWNR